jgi:ribosomal protein S18 acetylase RimI-like enzyme/predicted nucleic acid-binding protein
MGEPQTSVVAVEGGSVQYDQVLRLARENKARLGFLPDQAFLERCDQGTLLACLQDDNVLAYALYDLPGRDVALRHLCVDRKCRRSGAARRLVDEIANRHADRHQIRLDCRRDYRLNSFWQSLNFVAVGERRGRSATGAVLTRWQRSIAGRTLFDWVQSPRAAVALDVNVYCDLHLDRPDSAATRSDLADWIAGEVEFVITSELLNEINEHENAEQRQTLQDRAAGYRLVQLAGEARTAADSVIDALRGAMTLAGHNSPRDADLRHLAICSANGVRVLATRDGRLLAAGDVVYSTCAVRVIRPSELSTFVDENAGPDAYMPVQLAATSLVVSRVKAGDMGPLQEVFLSRASGERPAAFRANWIEATTSPSSLYQVMSGREPLALFSTSVDMPTLRVVMFRVAQGRLHQTLTRQLAWAIRNVAVSAGCNRVQVHLTEADGRLTHALADEGFQRTADGTLVAGCPATIVETTKELANVVADLGMPGGASGFAPIRVGDFTVPDAAALESTFWPLKVRGADLPSLIVPIRPRWASQLFDVGLNQTTLFRRDDDLGISRENVYFRSPVNPKRISAPARVLWYVSQDRDFPLSGAIRGASMLVEVVVASPRVVARRMGRWGVLDPNQIARVARKGDVMALRFTDTQIFENGPSWKDIRRRLILEGNRSRLQSPTHITEATYFWAYQRGGEVHD